MYLGFRDQIQSKARNDKHLKYRLTPQKLREPQYQTHLFCLYYRVEWGVHSIGRIFDGCAIYGVHNWTGNQNDQHENGGEIKGLLEVHVLPPHILLSSPRVPRVKGR